MRFDQQTLDLFDRRREVDVESVRPDGRPIRVPIWIVVDGGEAYIRSWLGDRGRWYQAAVDRPEEVTLHAGKRAIPVRVVPAVDEISIERCSARFERKYVGDPATRDMVRPNVLGTTLRVEPRDEAPPTDRPAA